MIVEIQDPEVFFHLILKKEERVAKCTEQHHDKHLKARSTRSNHSHKVTGPYCLFTELKIMQGFWLVNI